MNARHHCPKCKRSYDCNTPECPMPAERVCGECRGGDYGFKADSFSRRFLSMVSSARSRNSGMRRSPVSQRVIVLRATFNFAASSLCESPYLSRKVFNSSQVIKRILLIVAVFINSINGILARIINNCNLWLHRAIYCDTIGCKLRD